MKRSETKKFKILLAILKAKMAMVASLAESFNMKDKKTVSALSSIEKQFNQEKLEKNLILYYLDEFHKNRFPDFVLDKGIGTEGKTLYEATLQVGNLCVQIIKFLYPKSK